MWRVATTAGATLLLLAHCDVGFAQVSGTPPGMGATSPLGSSLSDQPSMPGGIPLGATELDSGGLSCSGAAMTAGSSFDGGGMASTATSCASGASGPPSEATSGSGPTVSGSAPLGSTELGTPGESPAVSSTSCSGISSGLSANC
jgi:hypothetical protein